MPGIATIRIVLAVETVIALLGLFLPAPFVSAAEPTSIPTPTSRIASASDRGGALPADRPKKAKSGKDRIQCEVAKSYEGPALRESIPAAQWAAARGSLDHELPEETAAALQSALDETLVRVLELAANHGSSFCPGQNWRYSNTGYLMLAQILETVEGKPYHEVIRDRLLTPLGIVGIRALAPQERLPGLITPVGNRHGDLETFNYSTPIGAGNLVGDSETVQSMLTALYPMFDGPTSYGRGLMVYELPEPSGVTHKWIGHSGGTPGYKAVVAFDLQTQAFAAVSFPADLPAEAMAHALFKALPSREGAIP